MARFVVRFQWGGWMALDFQLPSFLGSYQYHCREKQRNISPEVTSNVWIQSFYPVHILDQQDKTAWWWVNEMCVERWPMCGRARVLMSWRTRTMHIRIFVIHLPLKMFILISRVVWSNYESFLRFSFARYRVTSATASQIGDHNEMLEDASRGE